jgi:hypothetical protein
VFTKDGSKEKSLAVTVYPAFGDIITVAVPPVSTLITSSSVIVY